MIEVDVKDADSVDKALKQFKKKVEKSKVIQNLRERRHFTKPSVVRREQIKKAAYKERMQRELNG